MDFGEPGIRAITISLISAATVLALVSAILGLVYVVTGQDPLPKPVRIRMRRVPASAEDFRLRGSSLMLAGAGVIVVTSLLASNVVPDPSSGYAYAPAADVAVQRGFGLLVSAAASVVAIALFIGAYTLSLRVRYEPTARVKQHGSIT